MMPFIPDTPWGIAYMVALIVCGGAVMVWPRKSVQRVYFIFVLHWLSLRAINVIDHDNALVWVIHDVAFIAAVSMLGRSTLAYAVAAAFVPVLLFDQIWLIFGSTFSANAAVAEMAGYLAMMMIAGAAHGGGNRIRISSDVDRGAVAGYGNNLADLEIGRPHTRRSGVSDKGVEGHGDNWEKAGRPW